jgi:hypothetical protein
MAKIEKLTQEQIAEFEHKLVVNKGKIREKKKEHVLYSHIRKQDPNRLNIEEGTRIRVERELASFLHTSPYVKSWADLRIDNMDADDEILIADAVNEINAYMQEDPNIRGKFPLMKPQGFAVHIDRFRESYLRYTGIFLDVSWHPIYRRPIRVVRLTPEEMIENYDAVEWTVNAILSSMEKIENEA